MSAKILPNVKIELLEPRLAPAGTLLLSTAGGILTVNGDAAHNGIVVTDGPLTGSWTISDALIGTTFILNGVIQPVPFMIPAQNGIKMALGDGDDRIEIQPSAATSGLMLSGVLNLSAGKGDDIVVVGDDATQFLGVAGATSIDLGEGNDSLTQNATTLFSGTFEIKGGLGNDTILLSNGGTAAHTFLKGFRVDTGAGQDSLTIASDAFHVGGGAFTILGAGQAGLSQTINFNPTSGYVQTAATISVAAGNVTVNIGATASDLSRFGAGLTITAGAGNDTVNFNGTTTVAGATTVDMKDGNNTLAMTVGGASLQTAALTVKAGLGNDTLSLAAASLLTVNGAFSANLGIGNNTFSAAGDQLNAGSLNFAAGATGDDAVSFTGTTLRVLGSSVISLGGGSNSTTIDTATSAYFGAHLTVNGLAGDDDLTIEAPSTTVIGSLLINLGNGTNEVQNTGDSLLIGGILSYTGGTGNDLLDSSATNLTINGSVTFKAGGNSGLGGGDMLYLRPENGTVGAINYSGTAGVDTLQLGNTNTASTVRLAVVGGVTAAMGAGNGSVSIIDTTIQAALNVQSASAVANTDMVTVNQSTLNGAVTLNLGAGGSTTSLNDSVFRGAFLANLGAGADTILVDSAVATTALSIWYGTVQINAGAGSDVITLGSNPFATNAGNIFYKKVTVDGGADTDFFNQGNNTFVYPLTTSNI